jgi:hypothetical protein
MSIKLLPIAGRDVVIGRTSDRRHARFPPTPRGFAMNSTTISDLNVARFVDRLQLEPDPATRASLKSLLIKEEDRLGRSAERLGKLQRYIDEGSRRIALQKALIENLVAKGHDVSLAKRTLNSLVEIQRIFEQYREAIV